RRRGSAEIDARQPVRLPGRELDGKFEHEAVLDRGTVRIDPTDVHGYATQHLSVDVAGTCEHLRDVEPGLGDLRRPELDRVAVFRRLRDLVDAQAIGNVQTGRSEPVIGDAQGQR